MVDLAEILVVGIFWWGPGTNLSILIRRSLVQRYWLIYHVIRWCRGVYLLQRIHNMVYVREGWVLR